MRATLHAERHPARVAGAPRLVLVHGFTQTGACWAPVVDRLRDRYELVVVDAPGHGGSADLDDDLWTGGARLAATGGPAIYVGYSMGGRLALHAALARPDLVRALVLVGATAGIEDAAERKGRRADDDALASHLEQVGVDRFVDEWLANPLFAGLGPDVDCRAARRTNTIDGLASSLRRAGTGTQDDLWPRLAELGMPVLVLAGADDAKFATIGRRMAAAIGPRATFTAIADAGHTAPLEQPDAFVAILVGWIEGQAENQSPTASSEP